MITWRGDTPIYQQIKERLVGDILEGTLKEGDAVPSARAVASELQVNPITVSKAYQELTDSLVLETRRGLGTYVRAGGQETLLRIECTKFLEQEWPLVLNRIRLLGITLETLMKKSGDTL